MTVTSSEPKPADKADIASRMSAIRESVLAGTAEEDVLLLTDAIDSPVPQHATGQPVSTRAEFARAGMSSAATVAAVLLEGKGDSQTDRESLVREEIRAWLVADGKELLRQAVEEFMNRTEEKPRRL